MIQAKDFRIGNWVNANGLYEGKLMQVEQIGTKATLSEGVRVILFKDNHAGEFLKDCEPIPLTPEILLKCGFILDEDEGDKIWYKYPHHINNYHVQNDHECWVFAIVHSDGSYTDLIYDKDHFQFLHHLQNLFYALTGEELEFKP